MSALKLHTLKQKLWAIVAASFIARVIMFFALPSTPSSLAPDEGTYALLAKWVANGDLNQQHPYYTGLFNVSRSLIFPSSIFIEIGMDELSAIRLTSSLYGFLSLMVVSFFVLTQIRESTQSKSWTEQKIVLIVVGVYAFLPSHFLWSTLGLRESVNEFWLIAALCLVFCFYRVQFRIRFLVSFLLLISILATFTSRPQVGWVLVLTLVLYSLFKLKDKTTYLLITIVFVGLYAGYLVSTSTSEVTTDMYVAKDTTPTPTKDTTPTPTKDTTPTPTKDATPTPTNDATPTPTKDATPTPTKDATPTPTNPGEVDASKLCDGFKQKVEYEGKIYNCVKSGTVTKRERPSNLTEVAIDQVEALPDKQIINQVGAASMIERITCPWGETSEIGKYGCLAFRAPFMSLTFLFRPLPFIDTTSLSSILAAAENMIWITMFALIIYRIFKAKKMAYFKELTPSIIFLTLYIVGAGSYEGNMGTAFRHKSLILWIVLLLIFAVFWGSRGKSKEPVGNNSQESAV
jgi:hypothetical protein